MRKDFDAQTREKADGETRVLIMDGHSSHYTLELLDYARANNIITLGYPPHCTHVLQGLDVVCFAKMKEEFKCEVHQFEDLHTYQRQVTKGDFAGVFGRAYLRAFTEKTVKAAFSAIGVWPFNPDVITEKQMKPRAPSSTRATFSTLQPSPIRAIISAMGTRPPTSFELSPTTHHHSTIHPQENTLPTPTTSQRPRSEDIDPDLQPKPPTKRMRMLYGALAITLSGSLLVSKTRMTSSYKVSKPDIERMPELSQPDWTLTEAPYCNGYETREMLEERNAKLAVNLLRSREVIRVHELIEEGQAAQLVIQHLELTKLNQSLYAKENKKKRLHHTVHRRIWTTFN